ncbi:hypothetical protein PV726_40325 [Streptomyces europaeiscabiei]|uniref:hypothetical protein n=1 Tax=Streptomyces europaeiscabiei TaxID=146819 RepID=UPI0029A4C061|nr:hypothetical protein [Streptomyces europaeiscabiei]MDX3696439.1 hypothetical protein [Streptomyces europaeiscabiei]
MTAPFVSKKITDDIEAAAPIAQRLVREHFARRPLGAVELVVTKTNLLSGLVPHQATFALFTTSRRRSSEACLFRQMM